MSLTDGRPPYDELEVERIARALARGEAWGAWINTKECVQAFLPAIRGLGRKWLEIVDTGGALYLFEFAPKGKKIRPEDLPNFLSFKWLDREAARRVFLRAREFEWLAGMNPPSEVEIEDAVRLKQIEMVDLLPEFRRQMEAAL